MLRAGRAAMGLMAVALAALTWLWARLLFGPVGGMVALLACVLNPTLLAHGSLMTADATCALFFLAATGSAWAVLQRVAAWRVAGCGLLVGCLFVSKMSALLIIPVLLIVGAARIIDGRPLPVALWVRKVAHARPTQAAWLAASGGIVCAIAWSVVWMCHGFRFAAAAPDQVEVTWEGDVWEYLLHKPSPREIMHEAGLDAAQLREMERRLDLAGAVPEKWTAAALAVFRGARAGVFTPEQAARIDTALARPPADFPQFVLDSMRRWKLLPEAYLYGSAHALHYAQSRPAFLNGDFSVRGWRTFYPYAFAVKTPLALFALLGIAAAGRYLFRGRPRRPLWDVVPLVTLAGVYAIALVTSHLNIGHRHSLALHGPLFILCGAAGTWAWRSWMFDLSERGRRIAIVVGSCTGAALLALAVDVGLRFPHYIAYFNGIVRPGDAWRHLVDSSLDWGQDLPGVRRHLDENPTGEPAYLFYSGTASPAWYGIDAHVIASGNEPTGAALHALEPGTYFISATLLQPVNNIRGAWGPWNSSYEQGYQEIGQLVAPVLSGDPAVRRAALRRMPVESWQAALRDYEQLRFRRLTAYLRSREPDAWIGWSILVYHLDAAGLARAFDGPPAELGPDLQDRLAPPAR
jgi:hypothetical protein